MDRESGKRESGSTPDGRIRLYWKDVTCEQRAHRPLTRSPARTTLGRRGAAMSAPALRPPDWG
jgi:hypothetical protein